jgi:hypothetical protein
LKLGTEFRVGAIQVAPTLNFAAATKGIEFDARNLQFGREGKKTLVLE